jgi:hypothetical protein
MAPAPNRTGYFLAINRQGFARFAAQICKTASAGKGEKSDEDDKAQRKIRKERSLQSKAQ